MQRGSFLVPELRLLPSVSGPKLLGTRQTSAQPHLLSPRRHGRMPQLRRHPKQQRHPAAPEQRRARLLLRLRLRGRSRGPRPAAPHLRSAAQSGSRERETRGAVPRGMLVAAAQHCCSKGSWGKGQAVTSNRQAYQQQRLEPQEHGVGRCHAVNAQLRKRRNKREQAL
jgi:hypothetical protein